MPAIAASHTSGAAIQMWTGTPLVGSASPMATNMPSVNSRESPGRKKPTSRPVSAKMTSMTPRMAQGPIQPTKVVMMWEASSHSGPSMGRDAVGAGAAVTAAAEATRGITAPG